MILEVPFVYTVFGRRPRERTQVQRDLVDLVPVKVREVTGDEAPVVARCRHRGDKLALGRAENGAPPARFGRIWSEEVVAVTDYRLLDGQLMRRALIDQDRFLGSQSMQMEEDVLSDRRMGAAARAAVESGGLLDVTRDIAQSAMHLYAFGISRGAPGPVPRKPGDPSPRCANMPVGQNDMNRIDRDDRIVRAGEVTRVMRGAAFVDGVLYLPSFGPCWELWPGDNSYMALAATEPGWHHMAPYTFAAGDKELAERLCARGNRALRHITWHGEVEVFDDAARVIHPDEFALRGTARSIVDLHTQTIVDMRSPTALRALADIMEVVGDFESDPLALIQPFASLVAEYEARFEPGGPCDWPRQAMEWCLARVEERESLLQARLDAAGGMRP